MEVQKNTTRKRLTSPLQTFIPASELTAPQEKGLIKTGVVLAEEEVIATSCELLGVVDWTAVARTRKHATGPHYSLRHAASSNAQAHNVLCTCTSIPRVDYLPRTGETKGDFF